MPKKKSSSDGTNKLKIRGDKELAENITEISENHVKQHQAENTIKTNIRLKQFPSTEKQKEIYKNSWWGTAHINQIGFGISYREIAETEEENP